MSGEQLELFPLDHAEPLDVSFKPRLQANDPLSAVEKPFVEYMQQKEFSPNTVRSFLHDLKLFVDFMGADTTLADCSTQRLEQFFHFLQHDRGAPCSLKSLDRRMTTLKVLFGWLAANDVIPHDPAAPLIHHGAVSPLPQILSDAQVERVLSITQSMRDAQEAPDARPHLLVTLILSTAIKKAECMKIALEHLDHSDPERPSVYIHYDRPRQRFKSRRLALPPDWLQTLEIYLRRYQPKARLFECTARNLEYVLHTIATVARLPEMLTFETLRWTSAVRSLKAGMDPEHLRRRMGLSRISWHGTWPIIQKLAEGPL